KGKLRYMAPEQAGREAIDPRADVFSAGVVLFEATTGRSPYGAGDVTEVQLFNAILTGIKSKPTELVPDYPPDLAEIIMWAIETDRDSRCPSAHHLHDALDKFLAAGRYDTSTRAVAQWIKEVLPNFEARLFSPVQSDPGTVTSSPAEPPGTRLIQR